MLPVGILGINFKTAKLTLREAAAFAAERLNRRYPFLFPHPIIVLSTCNRTEIYFSGDDLAQVHSDLLAYLRECIEETFEHQLYSYFGNDCFAHLCRVAAGLDSAILAETEIQRQVKVAYREGRLLPSSLHYLFQKALKVGKLIRNHFVFEEKSPTLYTTLWKSAAWKKKRILLVGYSEINRGLLSFLMHRNVENISLCTTDPSQVKLEGVRLFNREILKRWDEFDLIVSATKASGYLISGKTDKETTLFDLSVPRNVDPNIGAKLYNIDQLIQERLPTPFVEQCEDLIWDQVARLSEIYRLKRSYTLRSSSIGAGLVAAK
jgi:glutamyl-tRNA reductase